MRRLMLALLCAHAASFAQSNRQWSNPELLQKGIPTDQYQAIGRGDLAQCRADAKTTVETTLPAARPCDTGQNPGAYYQCDQFRESRNKEREQMFKDLALGCMARKGWAYR